MPAGTWAVLSASAGGLDRSQGVRLPAGSLPHLALWSGRGSGGVGGLVPPPRVSPRAALGFLTAWLLDPKRQQLTPPSLCRETAPRPRPAKPAMSRDRPGPTGRHPVLLCPLSLRPLWPPRPSWHTRRWWPVPSTGRRFTSGLRNQRLPRLETTLVSFCVDFRSDTGRLATESFLGLSWPAAERCFAQTSELVQSGGGAVRAGARQQGPLLAKTMDPDPAPHLRSPSASFYCVCVCLYTRVGAYASRSEYMVLYCVY